MKKFLAVIFAVCLLLTMTASFAGAATTAGTAAAKAAEEEKAAPLTYEKAVELALKNSIELKNVKQTLTQSQKLWENAAQQRAYTNNIPMGPGYDLADAAARGVLLASIQLETTYQMAKRQVEIAEEKIAYGVKIAMDDVRKKLAEIKISKSSLDYTALKVQQSAVKNKLGIESAMQLQDMQKQYAEEQQQLVLLEKQLGDAYLKLNNLIGKETGERYEIAFAPLPGEANVATTNADKAKDTKETEEAEEPEPVFLAPDLNLETHITRILNNHPGIWMQEQTINMAEYDLELYTYNVGDKPYDVKQIDVLKAKNDLATLRLNVDAGLRNAYSQLKQLEDQYAALELKLARAEDGLAIIKIRYKVGMAVASDVTQAELGIDQLRYQMDNILIGAAQLKTIFEKPWLAS